MRPTREGKRFILAMVLIAFAALNTGNNLIYLVLSMMLSILALSAVLLVLNMRGIRLVISPDTPVYAGRDAQALLTVQNPKPHLPSYSLRLIGAGGVSGESTLAYVGAASSESLRVGVRYEKRGAYGSGSFRVQSGFPFIFFTRTVTPDTEGRQLVYPELREVGRIISPQSVLGEARRTTAGRAEEFLTLREFADGDDIRHVSWKVSARAGSLMVREYGLDEVRTATVVLVNTGPGGGEGELFETAVSLAASVCASLTGEGFYVRLLTATESVPFGSGQGHLLRLMDFLAVVGEESSWQEPASGAVGGPYVYILKDERSRPPWPPGSGEQRTLYASRV